MDCRAPDPARRHRQRYRVRTDKACRGRRLASPSGGWRARPAALRHPSTADRGDEARRDEKLTRIQPVTPERKYRRRTEEHGRAAGRGRVCPNVQPTEVLEELKK